MHVLTGNHDLYDLRVFHMVKPVQKGEHWCIIGVRVDGGVPRVLAFYGKGPLAEESAKDSLDDLFQAMKSGQETVDWRGQSLSVTEEMLQEMGLTDSDEEDDPNNNEDGEITELPEPPESKPATIFRLRLGADSAGSLCRMSGKRIAKMEISVDGTVALFVEE